MAWAGMACLAVWPGLAQQGHPLSGTWSGSWGAESAARTQITFVLDWDGKQVTGQLNPGPDSIVLKSVQLDTTNWAIRFEGDTKDKAGKPVHIAAEGKIENILSYHRAIAGTWHEGAATGDFKVTRE